MTSFKEIPVLDGNGDRVMLYEIAERAGLFGLWVNKRYELCSGERVERRRGGYVVVATGEKLTRVR